MPGLLESCQAQFGTDNLYSVIGVRKKATENEVKKGYHKVSLKVHPDRVPEDEKEEATVKFQTLGKVYCVLSNKDKRAIYDETGEVDDEDDAIPQDRDWTAYWRLLFRKVTTEDIKDFEKNYKGSEEELEDLQTAYIEFKGDMTEILNNVMCSTIEDEPRFAKIIKGWIKKKTVPDFPAFSKENKKSKEKRKREAEKEAAEAEELKQELGLKVDDSLQAMIQSRQQSRESQMGDLFSQLEAKYAQPKKAKTSKGASEETKKTPCSEELVGQQIDSRLENLMSTVEKPWKKVDRISAERCHELHRSNYVSSKFSTKLKKQMKAEGNPLRSGKWLAGEDAILLENLKRYTDDYPAYNPVEMLHKKQNAELKQISNQTLLYSRIAEGLNRTIYDAFIRITVVLFPSKDEKKGKYNVDEIAQLQNLYLLYGPKWNKIGRKLGRSERSVFGKWNSTQAMKTGRWSDRESSMLCEAVKNYRDSNNCVDEDLHDLMPWNEISAAVPGRTMYQCRKHWMYKLRNQFFSEDNSETRIKWDYDKKCKLVELVASQGIENEEDIDFESVRKGFQSDGIFISESQLTRQWRSLKSRVQNYVLKSFEEILDDLTETWQ